MKPFIPSRSILIHGDWYWYIPQEGVPKPQTLMDFGKGTYRFHRDRDKPAVIFQSGREEWYYNGLRHRENNKPAITYKDKKQYEEYWFEGKLHRTDGPAFETISQVIWCFHGKYHRYEGPAHWQAGKGMDWYIHGQKVNNHDYLRWIDETGIDLKNLTPEDKTLIDLRWRT